MFLGTTFSQWCGQGWISTDALLNYITALPEATRRSFLHFAACHSNPVWLGRPWIMLLSPRNLPRPDPISTHAESDHQLYKAAVRPMNAWTALQHETMVTTLSLHWPQLHQNISELRSTEKYREILRIWHWPLPTTPGVQFLTGTVQCQAHVARNELTRLIPTLPLSCSNLEKPSWQFIQMGKVWLNLLVSLIPLCQLPTLKFDNVWHSCPSSEGMRRLGH